MRSAAFGVRAGAVFLTSVVVVTSMIVIAHALKTPVDGDAFAPASGRDLPPIAEGDGDGQTVEMGDLRELGSAASIDDEPRAVITAVPVPPGEVPDTDTGTTSGAGGSAGTGAADGDRADGTTSSVTAGDDRAGMTTRRGTSTTIGTASTGTSTGAGGSGASSGSGGSSGSPAPAGPGTGGADPAPPAAPVSPPAPSPSPSPSPTPSPNPTPDPTPPAGDDPSESASAPTGAGSTAAPPGS